MPPTPITPAMQAIIDERVKAELKKHMPKKLLLTAAAQFSKYHDYEAYVTFFAKDENDHYVKDEKGFYKFDVTLKKLFFNTAEARDFLEGKRKRLNFYEEEEK